LRRVSEVEQLPCPNADLVIFDFTLTGRTIEVLHSSPAVTETREGLAWLRIGRNGKRKIVNTSTYSLSGENAFPRVGPG
jgi:hypothetical protein